MEAGARPLLAPIPMSAACMHAIVLPEVSSYPYPHAAKQTARSVTLPLTQMPACTKPMLPGLRRAACPCGCPPTVAFLHVGVQLRVRLTLMRASLQVQHACALTCVARVNAPGQQVGGCTPARSN